ncbi:hypothetical protein LCGC14_0775010 [marine sediment metagenome]|uniref:histidine kinase n=1 Tax=marine sediment metagenome TaxID=412755 RepID=A0A0F9T450_9ZZZZ
MIETADTKKNNSLNKISASFLISNEDIILEYEVSVEFFPQISDHTNLKGISFIDTLAPSLGEGNINKIKDILTEREAQIIEFNINVNKEQKFYEILISFLPNNQIFIIFRNIDNRKQMEFDLEKERVKLKNILDLNPYAIQIYNNKGYHIYENQAFLDLWNARPPKDFCVFEDQNIIETGQIYAFNDVLNGKTVYLPNGEYDTKNVFPDRDSHIVYFKAVVFPIFDKNKVVESFAVMYENITERRLVELELIESEEKLRKSEENLILLNKELEQKISDRTKKLKESEEKYREAYNLANLYKDIFAHDINNILQNIKSSAELSSLYLNSPEKLSTIKEFNVIINEQVTRGSKLINNIQKLSHIDESKITLNPVEVCINIKESIKFLQQSLPNKNINISVDSFPGEILVLADNLLLDVFENILFNGVRHNSNLNVKIGIKISKKKNKGKKFIKFEFTDNGVGIEDTRKDYIFQRGFGNKSKKGMGLGLSLVKKIIGNYNGEIWVENRVEGDFSKGSNFTILIPETD